MPRPDLGVVVGKFYPPHHGHKHLIDVAAGQVARLVVTRDWGLVELRPSRLSLEEVFLQLTTDEAAAAAPAQTPDAAA